MKEIDNKSNHSSSQNTSEEDQKKSKGQGRDEKEIVEVLLTDREDTTSVKNGNTVSVLVFSVSDYHQANLFVIISKSLIGTFHYVTLPCHR